MRETSRLTLVLASMVLIAVEGSAEDKVSYEVKFLLDSAAALECPCKSLSRLKLNLPPDLDVKEDDAARLSFFDTEGRALYADNWIVRVRRKQGEIAVTHKWRRKFDGDVQAAIDKAVSDGLTRPAEGSGKTEVDWGSPSEGPAGGAKTLSFSYEEGVDDDGLVASCAAARRGPAAFAGHRDDALARYGPIDARAWKVKKWAGVEKVEIEVWALPNGSYLVEASAKAKSADDAEAARDKLRAALQTAKLLARAQSSKTVVALALSEGARCPGP